LKTVVKSVVLDLNLQLLVASDLSFTSVTLTAQCKTLVPVSDSAKLNLRKAASQACCYIWGATAAYCRSAG